MNAMSKDSTAHIADSELIQAADGELSRRRAAEVQTHLAACWSCRARRAEIENTIAKFVQCYENERAAQIPPIEPARARLQTKLTSVATNTGSSLKDRASGLLFENRRLAYSIGGLALVLIYFFAVRVDLRAPHAASIPNSRLTPGATRNVTREDICNLPAEDIPAVPTSVAERVFEEYGIRNPTPRTYEVDYLITPALGGSADIQNLWPQRYAEGAWNSHTKDALEDRLRALVCDGTVALSTAQQDISSDWIAAYRKYFRTREPLEIHAGFALDPPWE